MLKQYMAQHEFPMYKQDKATRSCNTKEAFQKTSSSHTVNQYQVLKADTRFWHHRSMSSRNPHPSTLSLQSWSTTRSAGVTACCFESRVIRSSRISASNAVGKRWLVLRDCVFRWRDSLYCHMQVWHGTFETCLLRTGAKCWKKPV